MNLFEFLSFFGRQMLFCLLLFLTFSPSSYSQNQLRGTVVDSATRKPIPLVSIWTNYSHTISDGEGNFSLAVWKDDTVHFTHISYQDFIFKPDHDMHPLEVIVSLHQKVRLLDEVKVYSYLSESAFKRKIMGTIPVPSKEE